MESTRGFQGAQESGNVEPMALSRQVIEQAARQGGYISRDQLLTSGLSIAAIDRRVKSGALMVVSHGTYQTYPSTEHIDLIRGALLTLPNAVASHQSAAHLLDFPKLPKLVPTVTVASHTTHEFPGVTVHRNNDLKRVQLTTVDRVRVTNVLRTAFDLSGVLEYDEFDAIAEALILNERMSLHHYERITKDLARRGKPGSSASRAFIEARLGHDVRSSVLERKGRRVIVKAGLPLPIPQFPIPWDPRRKFDDAYPDATFALEWDSRAWHEQREAMAQDRKRDRECAVHGWDLIRFTWEDVTERPHEVAATVAYLLQERVAS